jgi:predicted RNase H-like HicB family nuclease
MDYQIFVEKQPNNGYVALALGWPDCVGTGETKESFMPLCDALRQ